MIIYNGISELLDIAIVACLVFFLIVVYTRAVGLRSFAKMSAVDFATTIAVGSMIASVMLPSKPSVIGGCFGILMIYLLQFLSSFMKSRIAIYSRLTENSPALLVRNGKVDKLMLKKVNVSEKDLIGKLREANVFSLSEVTAVVFESTGDVSVLHGSGNLDDYLLSDVTKKQI